jgi:hypothetical protein
MAAKAIVEIVGFCESTAQYNASSSAISEVVASALGVILKMSSSSVIVETYSPPTFANQKSSSSSVVVEVIATNLLVAKQGIDIYDESSLVQTNISCLDFRGADILAKTGTGTCVEVWVPSPAYASHFNTTDGITNGNVANVSTSLRYVASPTVEGTPFYTNGWDDLSTHACTRTSLLIWECTENISFINATTTFNILIQDGDSPQNSVVDFTTSSITGNGIYSGSNCAVTIAGWSSDSDKYKATVSISIDIDAIFPNSGYFDITISHINGLDGTFVKTQ